MFCNESKDVEGMARYSTEKVIESSRKMIKHLKKRRKEHRIKIIMHELRSQMWFYHHLIKWISFGLAKKPNRKSAIKARPRLDMDVSMSYGGQEEICYRLIRAAKSCDSNSMYLSTRSVRCCGL